MTGPFAKYLLGVALLIVAPMAQAACFDLGKSEPHELTGQLSYTIFPGPPNYEDVKKGDAPEGAYILTLNDNICLQADGEFSDPDEQFKNVHLVPTDATDAGLAALKNRRVVVTLERQMPAHTAHHHAPLVAWVTGIAPAKNTADENLQPVEAVRAFYTALGAGDGETAARFVVAEKREHGPLSADALNAFYGALSGLLKLLSLRPADKNRFRVSYTFEKSSRVCNGRATVTTTTRKGATFIRSIKALDGC